MQKPHPVILFGFLAALFAVLGGISVLKGGLYIGKHEGDTLHLMQIVFRMADGEWPHLDFMTPIGALAFAPIVLFVTLGFGIGKSIIFAQLLVAAALLPMAWWVGVSRLSARLAFLFGAFVMVLALALVHGEAQPSVSVSMHYNRWAWAFAFVAIALALLPATRSSPAVVDGVIIGVALAALAMIKATYFAAFIGPVLLALVLRGQFRSLFIALFTGLSIAAAITLFAGVGYWFAYFADLLAVARSEVRAAPGLNLEAVIGAPAYLGGSLVAFASVILLRQAGQKTGGLVVLLLLPGFFYVTYQNFGNDPQWMWLLAVLLFALRPVRGITNSLGWDMRSAIGVLATAALAFSAPSFVNLAYSPFRHYSVSVADYAPVLPRDGRNADLQTVAVRANRVDAGIALDEPGSGLEVYAERAERDSTGTLMGETLARCELMIGLPAWFDAIVTDLENAGFANGARIFAADLFSSFWLFGDLRPLEKGAPWYYGGLPGFDSADYVLVPLCPVSLKIRKQILDEINARDDIVLTEVRRTPLYILLKKG